MASLSHCKNSIQSLAQMKSARERLLGRQRADPERQLGRGSRQQSAGKEHETVLVVEKDV